jgi:hypothetical protein
LGNFPNEFLIAAHKRFGSALVKPSRASTSEVPKIRCGSARLGLKLSRLKPYRYIGNFHRNAQVEFRSSLFPALLDTVEYHIGRHRAYSNCIALTRIGIAFCTLLVLLLNSHCKLYLTPSFSSQHKQDILFLFLLNEAINNDEKKWRTSSCILSVFSPFLPSPSC